MDLGLLDKQEFQRILECMRAEQVSPKLLDSLERITNDDVIFDWLILWDNASNAYERQRILGALVREALFFNN